MIENNPPKRSESLRFNLYLRHAYRRILLFFCNTKISENSDMAKILSNFLLLRYLKSLIYNSVTELRFML